MKILKWLTLLPFQSYIYDLINDDLNAECEAKGMELEVNTGKCVYAEHDHDEQDNDNDSGDYMMMMMMKKQF